MVSDGKPPQWKTATSQQEYLSTPLPDPTAETCRWCKELKDIVENQADGHFSDIRICGCDEPNGKEFR